MATEICPERFPSRPIFQTGNRAHKLMNEQAVDLALDFAGRGALRSLAAMELPQSPKLRAWHYELIREVAKQLETTFSPDIGKDVVYWGEDPFWTDALNRYYEIRESGQTHLDIDLQAVANIASNEESPAYKLMDAMLSAWKYEFMDALKGPPRIMLALLVLLAELRKEEEE